MAIVSDKPYCNEHATDSFIWHTQQGHYQCDACWDDACEQLFKLPRQYKTNPYDNRTDRNNHDDHHA